MTTAHRPTWKAAIGKANEGGWSAGGARSTQHSALDNPAHKSLKFRPQNDDDDSAETKRLRLQQSLKALVEAEASAPPLPRRRPLDPALEEAANRKLLKQTADVDEEKLKDYDDSDIDDGGGGGNASDNNDSSSESDLDASSSEEEDSDDDDEAALQAELAKIRAEREAAQQKRDAALAAEQEEKDEASALLGNPLLQANSNANAISNTKKRAWNDDVVFRNQAKSGLEESQQQKKRFINDTVRNDFHKRFLNKFMR